MAREDPLWPVLAMPDGHKSVSVSPYYYNIYNLLSYLWTLWPRTHTRGARARARVGLNAHMRGLGQKGHKVRKYPRVCHCGSYASDLWPSPVLMAMAISR